MKKKIYYWSPFLSPIATYKAVINSANALMRYGSEYEASILNFFGEFNDQKFLKTNRFNLVNYFNSIFLKYLPSEGFIKSRFSFIIVFIFGFFPLIKVLKKNKPDYLIIHLITSLPLIILILFDFKTKFILRISGFPRLNFFRKLLWTIALKKIHLITCPTLNTLNYIKKQNIVEDSKIKLLYDPIVSISEINKKKKEKIKFSNYFLAVGRLTKQKNFKFLVEAFKDLIKKDKQLKLLIAGNGEEEKKLNDFIKKNDLSNNIFLLGFVDNIYSYFKNSRGFILTSLWEDPGFVLIEASCCRVPILSSNVWPGPVELIKDNHNGLLFDSNVKKDFQTKFRQFEISKLKSKWIFNSLIMAKKFTLFNHYRVLSKLLRN